VDLHKGMKNTGNIKHGENTKNHFLVFKIPLKEKWLSKLETYKTHIEVKYRTYNTYKHWRRNRGPYIMHEVE
jgi:hypothetical protein